MVTFKQAGYAHDAENGRVQLSKGKHLKDGWRDFVSCEYAVIGPPGRTIEYVQQARAIHEHGEWRLHFVCCVVNDVPDSGE